MKKNLLIMMMMVLCAGFVSAQTINTVRGFVPGGSTGADDNATYVVIGQPFSMMSVANADAQAEVMVGLAQMQLITDTTMTVVGYKDGYHEHGLDLNAQELLEALDDLSTCSNGEVEGYMGFLNFQKPNLAHNNDNFEYYYDSLFVVKVFICPDSTTDAAGNKYEVIALNEKCWINSNLRTTVACGGGSVEGMIYNSELNEVTEDMLPTYGMLYTFAAATGAANNADGVQCDEETGYLQGICPCNWHLPTVEEMAPLFVLPAENLRVNGNWIVEGNNNLTGFSAEPAGFYNATFDRFEGLLTETDYWMVNCDSLENPVQDVFQLIYSCNTPLKPKHSTDDALSVRCVYDIVREFDNCENPTPTPVPDPTPIPTPTPENDCPAFDTGGEQYSDGIFSMSLWDYDPIYFNNVEVSFTYMTENGEQDPVSVTPSFNAGDETNEVIMSAPFTLTEEMQKVMVHVNFVFKDEYSYCVQEEDNYNFSWECYPRCEDQNLAKVTEAGVTAVASNKISFELENYTDTDVLRFDGTVYVTDGGIQQALTVQNPHQDLGIIHIPNTNSWAFEYTPSSTTATVDSMKGYVRLNPEDVCTTSSPFNTSSFNATPQVEPTTGYTCPESLGSIEIPSSNNVGYDFYCSFNGSSDYIESVEVTYSYYIPGNINPDFTLNATNIEVHQYGEITFSNPTEGAPDGHSFDNVDHVIISVRVTLDSSCSTNFLDQTVTIIMN